MIKAAIAPLIVIAATFFSLSSGPFTALATQSGLIGWDKLTSKIKYRWSLLAGLFAFAYVTVDLLSNRSPVQVFISILTFNPRSAWNRMNIWHYGTAEVGRHPIFGIGLGEWERAEWMSRSMDNFWLVIAVRHGLPGFILYIGPILLHRLQGRTTAPERSAVDRLPQGPIDHLVRIGHRRRHGALLERHLLPVHFPRRCVLMVRGPRILPAQGRQRATRMIMAAAGGNFLLFLPNEPRPHVIPGPPRARLG